MARFDVVIVGGGHAGCEAAAAAVRMGANTALVTFDAGAIGAMSCNPAIGGLGKGHLVREVDACDGLIARATDAAGIHYRMLNRSKGPAVQGPRVQADRRLFRAAIQRMMADQAGLAVIEGEAAELMLDGRGAARGLMLADGRLIDAPAIVLATGTFLGGRMFRGAWAGEGGRVGERAATRLGVQMRALDLPMGRLKTGTPPRLDGRTIDWARLEEQPSDGEGWTMSPMSPGRTAPQLFCAVTRTNARTHAIIADNLHASPLHSGAISAGGPRYCPSIEDKVSRFGDREGHQIFLEPEGLDDHLVYPNGISTSLPDAAQAAMIASIEGLERARIVQPGYAVEYDHIDPRALDAALALAAIPGIFCAGQINGTTGYEEAAAQGLVAGANAAAHALGRPPVRFDRTTSYIGVMIDDLVLQGITEPYRMLTARAEHRLALRADNAETRLGPLAGEAGLLGRDRRCHQQARERARADAYRLLERSFRGAALSPAVADDGARRSLFDWLRFPAIDRPTLLSAAPELQGVATDVLDEIVIDGRYAPYLQRMEREREVEARDRAIRIPRGFDYAAVAGLSHEMRERLQAARPDDLAAASRIRGITPAGLAALLVSLKRRAA
ncbi:tRNA uridine-5-carboxymethylaminomethyl(34) synthesis enzyme MnmG [Sphingomonas gilva]|uniref:tRNA uridine 5-carboxymethylaminomethyl modification enzyme MnmG n=1 Tax=Sphingomonas gilva TaxID=2305907 RepID=A0A396RMT1_9SPHN|nr:tRNA uridine-5-carboxymethylaminomethyl(34) synthesis enzyme MnmG [Sphingomonas gilva]RHW17688.1 tRNA uridine-5-carboxymethylaminomethyl(34) synthesis enzyme MnmG [Sphingomonas gilva]